MGNIEKKEVKYNSIDANISVIVGKVTQFNSPIKEIQSVHKARHKFQHI